MSEIMNAVAEAVRQITQALGYPGIFIMMLVENLFSPLPSEAIMPFAGFIASAGGLTIPGILVSGSLGSLAGAVIIYQLGRKLGHDRLQKWICRYGRYLLLAPNDLNRALDFFDRHGKLAIFIGRLIPGVRSLISIPAGIKQMPMGEFLGLTLVGTLLWNTALLAAGYVLGSSWQRILEVIDMYELVLWTLLGAGVLYFVINRMGRGVSKSGC